MTSPTDHRQLPTIRRESDHQGERWAYWNSYQTFLSVSTDGDLLARVKEQLGSWLREKEWDLAVEQTGFHRGPAGQEILILSGSPDFRARLTEQAATGTWRTNLTVHADDDHNGWIALSVRNSEDRFASVPRLATYLLDSLDARDADTVLSPKPRIIAGRTVDRFLEELCHIERQRLIFVATPTSDQTVDSCARKIHSWTRETRGLGQVAIVAPDALHEFNEALGSAHRIEPGTIRTYKPDVDPAIESDGFRHRILSANRLANDPVSSIRKLLGRAARSFTASSPPPRRFTEVNNRLARLEQNVVIEPLRRRRTAAVPVERSDGLDLSITYAPAPSGVTGTPIPEHLPTEERTAAARLILVKSILQISEVDEASLRRIADLVAENSAWMTDVERVEKSLDESRERIQNLEEEVSYYQELTDDLEVELSDIGEERSKLADEQRWLRQRLADHQDFDTAYGAIPEDLITVYPASFADLVSRIGEFERRGVRFTGQSDKAVALDEHDTLGRCARTAWDALHLLAKYVEDRAESRFQGGIVEYLGSRVTAKRFAKGESEVTMNNWGEERLFPVPKDVDSSGSILMVMHFKLGKLGMVSPRMYFHDDFTNSQAVYVGYIGRHLTNTKTN